MKISVVVPTYNREDSLERCLEKLFKQNFDSNEYEILVADDGPSDGAKRLVENFDRRGKASFRYLPVTATQGPAAARNVGWRHARGEVIAFTDDDCLPSSDWLLEGYRAINENGAEAATGQTVVPLPDRPSDAQRDLAGLAEAEFITANCFCRKDVLESVGGFDERFTLAWREDSDLQFALLERGMRIVRAEQAVVVHPLRRLPWGISLKQQRKGIFDPLLYRKHSELYRRRIARLPRFYYAAVASLISAAVGAIAGFQGLFIGSIAVWTFLTFLFAAARLKKASRSPSHVAEMLITSAMIPPLSVYWRLRGAWRYRVLHI